MDLDFAAPFRCLSIDNILAIFYMLLRESKVLFLCHSNALLTEVMETFRSLLFPLAWSSCFVTRLPDNLSGLLQAPGGFMIGVHVEKPQNEHLNLVVESWGSKKIGTLTHDATKLSWMSSLQRGSYIVDLNSNQLYLFNGNVGEVLNANKIQSLIKLLPANPVKRLQSKLSHISEKFHLFTPNQNNLDQFDSAFEFHTFDDLAAGLTNEPIPSLEIRDAFLMLMADILGDIGLYVRPPITDNRTNTFRTFQEDFYVYVSSLHS
jgi:hypothetical protein